MASRTVSRVSSTAGILWSLTRRPGAAGGRGARGGGSSLQTGRARSAMVTAERAARTAVVHRVPAAADGALALRLAAAGRPVHAGGQRDRPVHGDDHVRQRHGGRSAAPGGSRPERRAGPPPARPGPACFSTFATVGSAMPVAAESAGAVCSPPSVPEAGEKDDGVVREFRQTKHGGQPRPVHGYPTPAVRYGQEMRLHPRAVKARKPARRPKTTTCDPFAVGPQAPVPGRLPPPGNPP